MITILRWLLRLFYGFTAHNEAVLKTPGPVLLLPNHVSWWDWLLVGVCLEEDWRFVTSSTTAEVSWIHKRIMKSGRTFPVDINSPYAVKHMAEYLQKGGRLVLFPEGRISATGSLMKLFDGTGFLIHRTHAKVITAYVRGAYRLPFSKNAFRKRWFPRLSTHFSDVQMTPDCTDLSATRARSRITEWLRSRMIEQRFQTEMAFGPKTVPGAVLATACDQSDRVILQDITMQKVTYRKVMVGANLLAQQWERLLNPAEKRVGVLLPNVSAMPVTLLSLWAAGKVPAVLNYTSGTPVMLTCARVAGLKQIIASRVFIQKARLDVAPFAQAGVELVYLEDVRPNISGGAKLLTMLRQILMPRAMAQEMNPDTMTTEAAVVLFTSGSEGEPKAVELSHQNLLANIRQMLAVVDLDDRDRFFNALPLFHSFGLSVGLLLPLAHGVFIFLYPSPLHYRVVPSAFYNLDCTVFFATNTFLTGYARKANPYDFRSLRFLFAGAEKLQEATSLAWMNKFGVRILEGYGATECSPCVSANLPASPRSGSAGKFLPGIEYRIEAVEGVAEGGRLFVRGPNIMRGYLNPEPNAKFQALGGWYDTGDIARVDEDGFLFILGRLKRFAKVSGEMVSLTAVEDALAGAFPEFGLKCAVAVISKPDEAKGERLIAMTNEPRLTLERIREAVRNKGLSNLAAPRELKVIHEIPRLGTGKVNHRELQTLV
jgi:acyl-[acyl-carrier-protein]-phospholipid O-acyltransferase/long-chain-fatty-acid--[acyl-carrier-protein] ligase